MNDSGKNKIDLGKVFRTSGYHLPIDESEVEDFEKNLRCDDLSKPADWDDPLEILERGKITKVNVSTPETNADAVKHLSMAARDGKGISDEVRKKMNEDRKNSKK